MKPQFCQYCGEPLENQCSCLRDLAEAEADLVEELENRPETQEGYRQQDLIDMYRRER